MTALPLSGAGLPWFDPWRATARLREARDRAQELADSTPMPMPAVVEFIAYCDDRIAAAFYPRTWP